jgi:GWxTD domain-containing protein
MIDLVNGIAETWLGYMASATIQATILALFILGVLRVGRCWPPALRHALLMLALCKFVIPPMFSLPTGLFNRITPQQWAERAPDVKNDLRPVEKVAKLAALQPSAISAQDPNVRSEREFIIPAPFVYKPAFSAKGKLFLLHLLGALLIFALAVIQKIRLHRLVSRAAPAEDPALSETYDELCLSMKLRIRPRLLICSDNHAPITFGAWKPVVILPQTLVDTLPLTDIRVILGHELAHHRRWDPWLAWLQVIISAIWWFNPVYWLLSRGIRSVREDCCDDMVLASGLASREGYCQTLLQAARAALENNAAARSAFAYLGKAQPLRRRFQRIMGARFICAPKLAAAGMLAISVLALALLPGVEPRILAQNAAPAESRSKDVTPAPAQQQPDNVLKAEKKATDDLPPFSPANFKAADAMMKTISLNMKMMHAPERDARDEAQPDSDSAPIKGQDKVDMEETQALTDLKVAQFYLEKRNIVGALGRLKSIKDNYPNFSRMNEVNLLMQQTQQTTAASPLGNYRKWLEEDVVYIIAPDERNDFLALQTDRERDSFVEHFWAQRGASFKAEHYRRIAYANEHFASSKPGWKTDRGRIYIQFGKPDEIESHTRGEMRGGVKVVAPYEIWLYRHIDGIGDGIEIDLVDLYGTGEYRMTIGKDDWKMLSDGSDSPFQRMKQYFESKSLPTGSLPFSVKTDYVRESAGKAMVRITIGLENKDLEFVKVQNVNRATIKFYAIVTNYSDRIFAEWEDLKTVEYGDSELQKGDNSQTKYEKTIGLPPGQKFQLVMIVADVNGRILGSLAHDLDVP